MLPIKGIYEIAIKVGDLARAEKFYCHVLGLEVGIRDERRNWLFLRAGGERGMIVLQEDKGDFAKQHFAFTVDESDIERAAEILRTRGVEVGEVVFHNWMPAKSVYFDDPDGNSLELCAPVKVK
jgi:catechol 2,3-dioxygenase-like lactoylglutathione lyase family enzyme